MHICLLISKCEISRGWVLAVRVVSREGFLDRGPALTGGNKKHGPHPQKGKFLGPRKPFCRICLPYT